MAKHRKDAALPRETMTLGSVSCSTMEAWWAVGSDTVGGRRRKRKLEKVVSQIIRLEIWMISKSIQIRSRL